MSPSQWFTSVSAVVIAVLSLAAAAIQLAVALRSRKQDSREEGAKQRRPRMHPLKTLVLWGGPAALVPVALFTVLEEAPSGVKISMVVLMAAILIAQLRYYWRVAHEHVLPKHVRDFMAARMSQAEEVDRRYTETPLVQAPDRDVVDQFAISVLPPEPDDSEHRSLEDFLEDGETRHLVLTGEGGMGKSTLLRYYESEWWRFWSDRRGSGRTIRSPLAVGIPAVDLIGAPNLFAAFGNGAEDVFGYRPGRKGSWIVMIDGLDEIADGDDRTRVERLIYSAANEAKNALRLVVTVRGLDDERWRRFTAAGFTEIRLRPFTEERLELFLMLHHAGGPERLREKAVFKAAHVKARRFVTRMRDVDMLDQVRLPLLAKVAAEIYFSEEGRDELPARRIDIYEAAVRHALAGFERRYADQDRPSVDIDSVPGFLGTLAAAQLADPRLSLVDLACDQLGVPRRPKGTDAWNSVLDLLEATGLIHHAKTPHARFLHKTFAEYLAAPLLANRYDGPASWVAAICEPDVRTAAVFAFAQLPQTEQAGLFEEMTGHPEWILGAGWLLAEGVCPARTEVIDRLCELLGSKENTGGSVGEVLHALRWIAEVGVGLRRVAGDTRVGADPRLIAARLMSVRFEEDRLDPLRELASVQGGLEFGDRLVAARLIVSRDRSAGFALLEDMVADTAASANDRCVALMSIEQEGERELALRLGAQVVLNLDEPLKTRQLVLGNVVEIDPIGSIPLFSSFGEHPTAIVITLLSASESMDASDFQDFAEATARARDLPVAIRVTASAMAAGARSDAAIALRWVLDQRLNAEGEAAVPRIIEEGWASLGPEYPAEPVGLADLMKA